MNTEKDRSTPAQRLGACLRSERERQGLSTHALARHAGLVQSQVVRIEQGEYTNPDPAKVAALAEALDVDLAELMATARFPLIPDTMSPTIYLRAKYRDLPADQLEALQHEVAEVLMRHGIPANDGPAPGEDETPPKRTRQTKGGTP